MICPFCGKEMKKGYIQSREGVFWTEKKHMFGAIAVFGFDRDAIDLNPKEGYVNAFMCEKCRKVIIDMDNQDE